MSATVEVRLQRFDGGPLTLEVPVCVLVGSASLFRGYCRRMRRLGEAVSTRWTPGEWKVTGPVGSAIRDALGEALSDGRATSSAPWFGSPGEVRMHVYTVDCDGPVALWVGPRAFYTVEVNVRLSDVIAQVYGPAVGETFASIALAGGPVGSALDAALALEGVAS